MWAPGVPAWDDVTVVDPRTMSKPRFVARVAREAPRYDAVIVNGSARFHDLYRDLVAGLLIGARRHPTPLVVAETAWDLGSAPLSRRLGGIGGDFGFGGLVTLGVRAFDGDHVSYCVFSDEERHLFCATFGIPRERVQVVRFGHSLWSRADGPTADGGYVFAGGDSLRDWHTLVEAVRGLGDVRVRIGTTNELPTLPANVTGGPVSHDEYNELLANARVVVVPMRSTRRGAGLITYMNAMALGKPVIATTSPAAHEYIDDGRTGVLVPPGDPRALREALVRLLDPAHAGEREAMGAAARAAVRTPQQYWQSLRDAAERAAARSAP
jgi:hypothetical protein